MKSVENVPYWRLMEASDLASVSAVAAEVHPHFPEDDAVFFNRFSLHGQGAYVFENGATTLGYAITHPWKSFDIPPLNTVLMALPDWADNYYIHDIALVNAARGIGAASEIVQKVIDHARRLGCQTISLVAVNGSSIFWHRHGFEAIDRPELVEKLATYSDDACFMLRQLR
ncbi:GNAT family N-acetyltransferase [Candidatus Phyllobacterium onerii]|jgi:GNAT superfamily N-acetyltransferase|uniref:GNAT family N-acetyltransferase n=1 Tax=Candidatus Phyllobacterium onerii TaxID=3020828 RepID=UPI00232D65BD|nr:GNAT family N-acetyltransferase [Phyllobacterium sp. IY22]